MCRPRRGCSCAHERRRAAAPLGLSHDARRDIVVKREHGDGRAADREARRCRHRRNQALKALPAFRQFGRDAGRSRMDLDADMMGDEAEDPLGVGR